MSVVCVQLVLIHFSEVMKKSFPLCQYVEDVWVWMMRVQYKFFSPRLFFMQSMRSIMIF